MKPNPLKSLADYSRFLAEILGHPSILRSTVHVWSDSPWSGIAEGEVFGGNGMRLRMREGIDFAAGLITSHGYEFYRGNERLFWYDDFPHPNDPTLAATYPHHKHVPPDMRRNRVPAPEIKFDLPNLPFLMTTLQQLAK